MKILSVAEAQARFSEVCQEALAGEVIRLSLPNGELLELMRIKPLSAQQLRESYDDPEWAAFENRCGKSSN